MGSPGDAVGEGSPELSWALARVSAALSHIPVELVPTLRELQLCCLMSLITSFQS